MSLRLESTEYDGSKHKARRGSSYIIPIADPPSKTNEQPTHRHHQIKRGYSIVNGLASKEVIPSIFGSKWPTSFVQTPGEVATISFSPNGKYLACGDRTELIVLHTSNGETAHTFEHVPTDADNTEMDLTPDINDTAWSSDSLYLAGCDTNGNIIIRSIADGHIVWQCKHDSCVRALAFSPSKTELILAAGNWDNECW